MSPVIGLWTDFYRVVDMVISSEGADHLEYGRWDLATVTLVGYLTPHPNRQNLSVDHGKSLAHIWQTIAFVGADHVFCEL